MTALTAPFRLVEGQIAVDLPGGHVLFTTRSGGDLGCEPGGSGALRRAVPVPPERWAEGRQVHESHVHVVRDGEVVRPHAREADGQATARRDVACVVRTADCLPVALVAPEAVAMLHAGWRGLAAGVIEEGVKVMGSLGASEIRAAIGPHARACCYETGEEVHAAFSDLGPEVRHGDNADLEQVARLKLARGGVREVHSAGLCTICAQTPALWSFRREGELAGRQGGFAWRN